MIVQSLMDVEEHPGGAVSNYTHISDVVKQMQIKVDAMHACHSYYISHAYTQVRQSRSHLDIRIACSHEQSPPRHV